MRYYSKRYKSVMSNHYRKAREQQLSLLFYIDTLAAFKEARDGRRERRKYGEHLMWEKANTSPTGVRIPFHSGRGKPLGYSVLCWDTDMLEQLQQDYSPCPDPIKAKLLLLLQDKY